MKTHRILLSALMALPGLLPAQTVTSGVPGFISYQGRVLDSAGAAVGTGTPVNRTVVFRVWDHQSSIADANLIYSEQQTVTIADGKFSVLVGQGVATSGTQFSYSETSKGPPASIANAFNGSGRYLGVTVDDGTVAVDNEIAPRQQVVTSAFAFRSKFAETLGTSTASTPSLTVVDGGNIGVGNTNPPALFTISGANTSTTTSNTQMVVTADDVSERLRVGVDSTGNGTSFLQSWKEGTGATNLLLNPNGGNVGIGTATPNAALDVNGAIMIRNALLNASARPAIGSSRLPGELSGYGSIPANDDGFLRLSAGGGTNASQKSFIDLTGYSTVADMDRTVVFGTSGVERMRINASGSVGIGTTTPTVAKLVVSGTGGSETLGSHYTYGSTTGAVNALGSFPNIGGISIKASDAVHAAFYRAVSDARIKVIEGVSNGVADLAMLSRIEITDYTHKDVIAKGKGMSKKVIAQQVEKVFPQAVTKTVDVVPDIYQAAKIVDGWIELPTDLKKGERVRLIGEKHDEIHQVLEVEKDRFLTAYRHEPKDDSKSKAAEKGAAGKDQSAVEANQIFVFGREVKDFRVVDYEAIAMLNVSATQQIKKENDTLQGEVKLLKDENAGLKQRLAEMDSANQARDVKLAAIEKLLQGSDKPALRTVSLKSAE
jgi:hypothetical protein